MNPESSPTAFPWIWFLERDIAFVCQSVWRRSWRAANGRYDVCWLLMKQLRFQLLDDIVLGYVNLCYRGNSGRKRTSHVDGGRRDGFPTQHKKRNLWKRELLWTLLLALVKVSGQQPSCCSVIYEISLTWRKMRKKEETASGNGHWENATVIFNNNNHSNATPSARSTDKSVDCSLFSWML